MTSTDNVLVPGVKTVLTSVTCKISSPSSGSSFTGTVGKVSGGNGAPTGLTCTVPPNATTCTAAANVTVLPTESLYFLAYLAGGVPARTASWTVTYVQP